MTVLDRPRLIVECAFATNPFVSLADETLAWIDISDSLEVGKGVSVQRRRADELDEPSAGTLSLWLNNADGRFTRLNTAGPYYPYVKLNRLIRLRAQWPSTAVNLLNRRQATGGQGPASDAGWFAPSGTLTSSVGTATATAAGTTTTLLCADADAGDIEVGDVITLADSGGAAKESTYFAVTGKSSAAGTTTITFTPAAAAATATGDVATRARAQWVSGLQLAAGTRVAAGSTATTWAGPDGVTVTAGTSYTFSVWASRGTAAMSVSPRIAWYDLSGALISETAGGTVALATSLQRLTLTATAPAGARLARVSIANETIFAGSPTIGFRGATTAKNQYATSLPVTVHADVAAGDGMLLWVNLADSTRTVTTPSGWTYVTDVTDGNQRTYLFKAAATSAGATTSAEATFNVALTGTAGKVVATLAAWSGTDPTDHVHQINKTVEASSSATHTTPNVTTTVANCWIASACFDRSTTTTAWTKPVGDTERATVFTTGGGAATGVVSDNNAPVAAGTYGGKTFTSNTETTAATMWTVALKPSPPSGDSSGTLQATGWQFEQAASVSAWSAPSQSYTRFVGHVDQWPTQWDGGTWAVANVTATDRSKLLADDTVGAAITENILNGAFVSPGLAGPIAYYPLGEDSAATAAGNDSRTVQPSLQIVSAGTVTDEMLEFGGGTGPGVDGQAALKLTPTSSTVGKALRGSLYAPLGGDGVTEMTVAGWFNSTVTGSSTRVVCGADDGKVTDTGAVALFDISINPGSSLMRAHLKIPGADINCDQATNYADGRTHLAAATATISGGTITVRLYVDGALKNTTTAASTASEFLALARFNIGCGALDTVANIWSGTLSHCAAWNRALSATEVSELWVAGAAGFAGDHPGDRCTRLAAWKGLKPTAFEIGDPTTLAAHPATEQSLMEAFKQVARSDGGLFFVDRAGFATLHAHGHRLGAEPVFSLTADQIDPGMTWNEDATLVANDVTVTWGSGSDSAVRATDQASVDDYGRQKGEVATILQDDRQAADRAAAYLTRYSEPISRPSEVIVDALTQPDLWTVLLDSEYGQKFSITGLPTGAPASSVDLFIEGIGEEISADTWRFTFDSSPAGFDFGLLLDDPVRGLLDSNYMGW